MTENAQSASEPIPQSSEPAGNIKVTRQDWLDAAMDILVSDGVERVKVLTEQFDGLVREAYVSERDWPGHLQALSALGS